MSRQMSSGMAFEYAVALSFSQQLTISIAEKEYVRKVRNAFDGQAESKIKPSLKFDIQIIGLPAVAGRQQIQLYPSVG